MNHISQTPECRPCIITEPLGIGRTINDEIPKPIKRHNKALFHFWEEHHQYYNNAYGCGTYIQPSHTIRTMAIVEYEDGTVHEVLPEQIQFVDGKIKEYDFKTDVEEQNEVIRRIQHTV